MLGLVSNSKKVGLLFSRSLSSVKQDKAAYHLDKEFKFAAHNYNSVPVVISKGKGIHVWDVNGKKYFDCLSGYSSINQGHLHPRIVAAAVDQLQNLSMASRAFHNDIFSEYCEYATKLFKYDKLLPMNSGVEGSETAIKLARRWAYTAKGVPENKAVVLFAEGNFMGRSIAVISASNNLDNTYRFGPFLPGMETIPFNDLNALETKLKNNPNIAAFMVEPIQGENGVIIPDDNYLRNVRELCTKHNVLFIADEVQTGLGRTGKMLCSDNYNVRPDVVVLAKSLSGGIMPISAILADDDIMLTIGRGHHGSTFGGMPLSCRVALESLRVLVEEKMCENSEKMGKVMLNKIKTLPKEVVSEVRGKGLFVAMVIDKAFDPTKVCYRLAENGVLSKNTHNRVIRLSPPLTINEEEIGQIHKIMDKTVRSFME
uniref:Ornithine aminotransferase n=1 Tax=Rhabditophanes sp. KR3021 TaxID=114890 RepID=A0AC35TS29_9BILA